MYSLCSQHCYALHDIIHIYCQRQGCNKRHCIELWTVIERLEMQMRACIRIHMYMYRNIRVCVCPTAADNGKTQNSVKETRASAHTQQLLQPLSCERKLRGEGATKTKKKNNNSQNEWKASAELPDVIDKNKTNWGRDGDGIRQGRHSSWLYVCMYTSTHTHTHIYTCAYICTF